MKFLTIMKVSTLAVVAAFALNLTATTFAISSTANNKVRDFKLKPANGNYIRTSDISIAVRNTYAGVRPKITKRQSSMKADCYDVKFVYKNELKRVSFNCNGSRRYLTMRTR